MKQAACLALCALPLGAAGRCIAVESSLVEVRHVSASIPALSALPGDLLLGYAPSPGLARWWKGQRVRALGLRRGIDPGEIPDFCVERPARAMSEAEVVQALTALLPAGASLQVVDYCRLPMPRGELQFTLKGLGRPPKALPETLLVWRGRVAYEQNRSSPFWATVKITVRREGAYAARAIPQGKLVEAADLRMERREESIFSPVPESDAGRLIGRRCRRAIAAGTVLTAAVVEELREVNPGETVEVQVQSAAARLKLEARAVNGGHLGEQVLLLNKASGKQFRAVIDGRSRAVLDLEDPGATHSTPRSGAVPASQHDSVEPGRRTRSQGQGGARRVDAARKDDPGI